MLISNHKNLEFLSMNDVSTLNDVDIKMERVETVLMTRYGRENYTDEEKKTVASLCPNAEILIGSTKSRKGRIQEESRKIRKEKILARCRYLRCDNLFRTRLMKFV